MGITGSYQCQLNDALAVNHFIRTAGGPGLGQVYLGTTNQWWMVTVSYNGTGIAVYRNGSYWNWVAHPSPGPIPAATWHVGLGGTPADAASLNGQIDDFRIYTRALTGQEVTDLYNATPPVIVSVNAVGADNEPSKGLRDPESDRVARREDGR